MVSGFANSLMRLYKLIREPAIRRGGWIPKSRWPLEGGRCVLLQEGRLSAMPTAPRV